MNNADFLWAAVPVVGAIAGIFFRPHYVAIAAGCAFLGSIAGLILTIVLGGREALLWGFGIAAMASPFAGGLAFGAAALSHSLFRRRASTERTREGKQ